MNGRDIESILKFFFFDQRSEKKWKSTKFFAFIQILLLCFENSFLFLYLSFLLPFYENIRLALERWNHQDSRNVYSVSVNDSPNVSLLLCPISVHFNLMRILIDESRHYSSQIGRCDVGVLKFILAPTMIVPDTFFCSWTDSLFFICST